MFREDISSSPVIQQQQHVVRELTLSDRDRRERERETVTPGPAVSGAGTEESDTPDDTDSVSSSEHRDNVTITSFRGSTSYLFWIRSSKLTSPA